MKRKLKCDHCGGKVRRIEPRTVWTPHGDADVTHQCTKCYCLFGEGKYEDEQSEEASQARQEENQV